MLHYYIRFALLHCSLYVLHCPSVLHCLPTLLRKCNIALRKNYLLRHACKLDLHNVFGGQCEICSTQCISYHTCNARNTMQLNAMQHFANSLSFAVQQYCSCAVCVTVYYTVCNRNFCTSTALSMTNWGLFFSLATCFTRLATTSYTTASKPQCLVSASVKL